MPTARQARHHDPRKAKAPELSHIAPDGAARMVDVAHKPTTIRSAVAEAVVRVSTSLARAIRNNGLAKGDALSVARLAGIMGAKRTAELIPLCHPLPLDRVECTLRLVGTRVIIRTAVGTTARTGVEMEAILGAAIAAVTVIDMGKSVDRAIEIESVRLIEKRGGTRGDYAAPPRRLTARRRRGR